MRTPNSYQSTFRVSGRHNSHATREYARATQTYRPNCFQADQEVTVAPSSAQMAA